MTARGATREVVLDRIAGPGHGSNVLFMRRVDEMTTGSPILVEQQPTLFLDAADFRALGEPERITVTIQAGERPEEEQA
jgi:hypothetical protein